MNHPSARDLVNFARDELGGQKKSGILDHCRQCPECAEKLIEATRENAPPPGPIKLSRFNKLSIVFLIVALIATVFGLVWFLNQLGNQAGLPPVDLGKL